MTYTCACYPHADATLEEAQENKYRLVFEKLRLQAGRPTARRRLRLGRHGALRRPPRRQGDRRHAVEGAGGVGAEGDRRAGPDRPRPRSATATTATSRESGFDAVSSIGLTEHIGVHNYPAYFRFLQSKMRTGALLLNHCITRPDNRTGAVGGRLHRPLRVPRRGAHRLRPHHHRGAGRRPRGGARGEPAPPLRADAARLVPQPRRALGRGGRRGRAAHREGVGPLHGGVPGRLRDECRSAAPGSGGQARRATAATAACRCGRGGRPEV